ncbi:hypothetical protein L1987_45085 [Smallanthus sonchifolius]|uniref:Uncharacterized protein n=1 Tax=Smallanthus sonchifolius TaxID=185202 RepID=A0ACB9GR88_9ASTR|nr:hypothetical protein L1987_45085 [Smallanthus sonchifolius]
MTPSPLQSSNAIEAPARATTAYWGSITVKTLSTSRLIKRTRNPIGLRPCKENVDSNILVSKQTPIAKSHVKDKGWKPSSLQLCMQLNDLNPNFGSHFYEPLDSSKNNSGSIWDYSDSESAPASSWSTIPNRSLLCRPLPVDIRSCSCIIVKEKSVDGLNGGSVYTLYTNEGQGRQNRKLAVAYHRRHNRRSEFVIAQNTKGILCCADDSYVGSVTANLMGSKYHIWDQGRRLNPVTKQSKLLALVCFVPTIAIWTGSYRSIKAWLPKHQSMQLNTTQISKQYELDFRNRGKAGLKIQSSVKNFQLTMEISANWLSPSAYVWPLSIQSFAAKCDHADR